MDYSDLPTEAKEPVFLPREHRLTHLQIQRCHKKVLHCGVKSTLTELRPKFWVPKGRQVVKKVLNQCVTCKKLEGTPFAQPATSILAEFSQPSTTFFESRSRFCGTIPCKRARKANEKRLCCSVLMLFYKGTAPGSSGRSLDTYLS